MSNTLAFYADYDSEFALFEEECRLADRATQCSVTHAVAADEMQCIENIEREAGHASIAATFHRWSVAHALYGVILAREGL